MRHHCVKAHLGKECSWGRTSQVKVAFGVWCNRKPNRLSRSYQGSSALGLESTMSGLEHSADVVGTCCTSKSYSASKWSTRQCLSPNLRLKGSCRCESVTRSKERRKPVALDQKVVTFPAEAKSSLESYTCSCHVQAMTLDASQAHSYGHPHSLLASRHASVGGHGIDRYSQADIWCQWKQCSIKVRSGQ